MPTKVVRKQSHRTSKTKKMSKKVVRKTSRRNTKKSKLSGGAKSKAKSHKSSKHRSKCRVVNNKTYSTVKQRSRKMKGGNPFTTIQPPAYNTTRTEPAALESHGAINISKTSGELQRAINKRTDGIKLDCTSANIDQITRDIQAIEAKFKGGSDDVKTQIVRALNASREEAVKLAGSSGIPYIPNIFGLRYRLSKIIQGIA